MRTLHVDDLDDRRRNSRQGALAAGFEQQAISTLQQFLDQRKQFPLL
jgi:hypothetical protein